VTSCFFKVHREETTSEEKPRRICEASFCGYRFAVNLKKLLGWVALITAVVAVIVATIVAAGQFGGGKMGMIAAGIIVGGVSLFSIAGCLLVRNGKCDPAQRT
jgi:hypothetical protein